MLENFLIAQIDQDDDQQLIRFQQDVAPPHYLTDLREFLNTHFQSRWIGQGGLTAWSPRSPDLTPLDFFLGFH